MQIYAKSAILLNHQANRNMTHLGFTFYPKDWWTSDSFYTLNPSERYIYLELLFMMYDNGGSIKNDKVRVERRLCTTIKDDVWLKITDLMVEDGDQLTHNSVNKRLRKAVANRENGKKGGRPKKQENETYQKPKKPKKETQKNPPFKRESEIENESEIEIKNKEEKFKKEFPFAEVIFMKPFLEWLEYKRERRESYKSIKSLKLCYEKLVELSSGDAGIAMEIVKESMANNWQGLFKLKTVNYPNTNDHGIGVWIEDGKKYYGSKASPIEIPMNAPRRTEASSVYYPHQNKWMVE